MIETLQLATKYLRSLPRLLRYGLTLLLLIGFTGIQWLLFGSASNYPFLFYFVLVALNAYALGTGLVTTLLAGLLADYLFIAPEFSLVAAPLDLAALLVFFVAGAIVSAVIEALHRSNTRLYRALAEAERLNRDREALTAEMNHRIKNNFQLVASTLSLQMRRTGDPTVRSALQMASERINTMARVHNRLVLTPNGRVAMEARPFIEHLCSDLQFSLVGARPIRIVALCVDIELKLSQATTLGLLINELVTNALKHAFPGDRAGTVTVRLACDGERCRLTVADDGVGFGNGDDGGIGNRLIEILARQLDGEPRIAQNGGTIVTVDFPRLPFGTPPAPPDSGSDGDFGQSRSRNGGAETSADPASPATQDRGWL